MKKIIGVLSVIFMSLMLSSAFASEPPMDQTGMEETQATLPENQSALERFAVWPFESIEQTAGEPGNASSHIDKVQSDLTVDPDGQSYFPVQDDESD